MTLKLTPLRQSVLAYIDAQPDHRLDMKPRETIGQQIAGALNYGDTSVANAIRDLRAAGYLNCKDLNARRYEWVEVAKSYRGKVATTERPIDTHNRLTAQLNAIMEERATVEAKIVETRRQLTKVVARIR
jgi:DNA-binding MarR family transcriptional regulator